MSGEKTRVWDLATRLFHWSLVILVSFSILSAHLGGNWIEWHMRSGVLILTLLVFRVLWGFFGPYHSKFVNFVRAPATVLAYARAMRSGDAAAQTAQAGHNPLGALSVLAILAVLLVQVVTGLFSNDDIASEGPLAKYVSNATSTLFTKAHHVNEKLIYLLIALHIGAIVFYAVKKGENLVRPMVTGDKPVAGLVASRDDWTTRLRAAILLAIVLFASGFLYR